MDDKKELYIIVPKECQDFHIGTRHVSDEEFEKLLKWAETAPLQDVFDVDLELEQNDNYIK